MNNDILKVKIVDAEGNIKEMDILFTFSCEELNKDYVVVTDWTYSDKDELNISVYSYNNGDKEMTNLIPVVDSDELQMAYDILDDWKAINESNNFQEEV